MHKTLPIHSGIYCIRNTFNNKVYIGSAINIRNRVRHHISALRRGKHPNSHLQDSWKVHTEKNFSAEVVERCQKGRLSEREEYYIKFYNAIDDRFGYNYTSIITGRQIRSEESIRKQREKIYGEKCGSSVLTSSEVRIIRDVYQKGRRPYIKEIAKIFKVSPCTIQSICANNHWKRLDSTELTEEERLIATRIKEEYKGRLYRNHLHKPFTLVEKVDSSEILKFNSIKECADYFGRLPENIKNSIGRKTSKITKKYNVIWKVKS